MMMMVVVGWWLAVVEVVVVVVKAWGLDGVLPEEDADGRGKGSEKGGVEGGLSCNASQPTPWLNEGRRQDSTVAEPGNWPESRRKQIIYTAKTPVCHFDGKLQLNFSTMAARLLIRRAAISPARPVFASPFRAACLYSTAEKPPSSAAGQSPPSEPDTHFGFQTVKESLKAGKGSKPLYSGRTTSRKKKEKKRN